MRILETRACSFPARRFPEPAMDPLRPMRPFKLTSTSICQFTDIQLHA